MERLTKREELAKHFKVTKQTIYIWQKEGMPHEKLGKRLVRYNIEEVREWLNGRLS